MIVQIIFNVQESLFDNREARDKMRDEFRPALFNLRCAADTRIRFVLADGEDVTIARDRFKDGDGTILYPS